MIRRFQRLGMVNRNPSSGVPKHVAVPVFGLLANLLCMLFYLIGPFSVAGMSWKEPYVALGIAALAALLARVDVLWVVLGAGAAGILL